MILTSICLFSAKCLAGVEWLSEQEFRNLGIALAPQVWLFRTVWEQNPEAEIAGGVSGDYYFWLKGQFQNAKTRDQAIHIKNQLLSREVIESEEFLESDADVSVYSNRPITLDAKNFGVNQIESKIPENLLEPTERYKNERAQGFLPIEKIRLSKVTTAQAVDLGDGVREIYQGIISVHYGDSNAKSISVKKFENHPVIYALKYIRALSTHYLYTYGDGVVDEEKLLKSMDAISSQSTKEIFASAADGNELTPFLANARFTDRINSAFKKALNNFVSPKATQKLFNYFQADKLPAIYQGQVDTLSSAMYGWKNKPTVIDENLKKFRVDKDALFLNLKTKLFSDGYIYHGTSTAANARSILARGLRPGGRGNAGYGIYGVDKENLSIAQIYEKEGAIIRAPIESGATIVSFESPEFSRLWQAYNHEFGEESGGENFYRYFGIDVVRMRWNDTTFVYAIKNASVLGRPESYGKSLVSIRELLDRVKTTNDPDAIIKLISDNDLLPYEAELLWQNSKVTSQDLIAYLKTTSLIPDNHQLWAFILQGFNKGNYWHRPEIINYLVDAGDTNTITAVVTEFLLKTSPNKLTLQIVKRILQSSRSYGSLGRVLRFYPEHPELIEEYMNRGTEQLADVASSVLSESWCLSHPDWFEKVVEALLSGRIKITNGKEKIFFGNELLQRNFPELYEKLIAAPEERVFSTTIIHYGMVTSEATRHPNWYLQIIKHFPWKKEELQKIILESPEWKQTKLYRQILANREDVGGIGCEDLFAN